jgi:hypothetical protein
MVAVTSAFVFAAFLLGIDASAFAEIALGQVDIRLERMSGGGCSHCGRFSSIYDVTIRGDGAVEYRDASEPDDVHVRSISSDEAIALANEFIAAGFLEARDSYRGKLELVRQGNGVQLKTWSAGGEDGELRLTLRIGDRVKRVSLVEDYPDALGRLPALVDRIGGPNVWRWGIEGRACPAF